MPGAGNWSEITILKEELEASLEMYASLKKENQELRQEIARLKSQISSLKAHDNERKSLLWKKIHNQNSTDLDQKSPPLPKSTEESLQESIRQRVLRSACVVNREKGEAEKPPKAPSPSGPALAPPPPPPPPKALAGAKALRRVPEVIELYRSLTKKDTGIGGVANQTGVTTVTATRSMIGEIENRSAYLSSIKTEVERQGPFIDVLIKEVESATFRDISEVEAFVKWLDGELVSLVDERAVLKHFPRWPENKADSLREAAFSYRDMANLESEVASFRDDPKEPFCSALRRIQALQDRLEQSVNNVERFSCGSLALIISPEYEDFFSRGLSPQENYWPISSTDLCINIKYAVSWGNAKPYEAEAIGQRGQEFMGNLSMERVYDYMYNLLVEYSKLLRLPNPPLFGRGNMWGVPALFCRLKANATSQKISCAAIS